METDLENTPLSEITVKEAELPTLAKLCASLTTALTDLDYPHMALMEQAHFLDRLFYRIVENIVEDREINKKTLDLALRAQRQCVETLRVHASIQYMRGITPIPLSKHAE
ncbi:MAG: hypothetical protein WBK55_00965 [Alphaproteobacteria bacterium]